MVIDSDEVRLQGLLPYVSLLEKLIAGELDLDRFEISYFDLFKNDKTMWADEEFSTLNDLFMDLDSYNADPNLRGPDDLDEAQMMLRIPTSLGRLNLIVNNLKTNGFD